MAPDPAATALDDAKALKTAGPAPGLTATDTERHLHQLADTCWTVLQHLIRDHEQLLADHAETAEELARWTGDLEL